LARNDADVRELAAVLGLGAFPYQSFRNPPVRHAPLAISSVVEASSPEGRGAEVVAIADRSPPSAWVATAGSSPAPDTPAGHAQVIAWPTAAMQGAGNSAPDAHRLSSGSTSTAPVSEQPQFPLVLATMACSALPPAAVQGPPHTERPVVASAGLPLLVAALGVAVSPAQPSVSLSSKGGQASVTGEYPLLQAALATEGQA
jgi:hypothetical protein